MGLLCTQCNESFFFPNAHYLFQLLICFLQNVFIETQFAFSYATYLSNCLKNCGSLLPPPPPQFFVCLFAWRPLLCASWPKFHLYDTKYLKFKLRQTHVIFPTVKFKKRLSCKYQQTWTRYFGHQTHWQWSQKIYLYYFVTCQMYALLNMMYFDIFFSFYSSFIIVFSQNLFFSTTYRSVCWSSIWWGGQKWCYLSISWLKWRHYNRSYTGTLFSLKS